MNSPEQSIVSDSGVFITTKVAIATGVEILVLMLISFAIVCFMSKGRGRSSAGLSVVNNINYEVPNARRVASRCDYHVSNHWLYHVHMSSNLEMRL